MRIKKMVFDRLSGLKKRFSRICFRPSGSWLQQDIPYSRVFGLDRGAAIDRKFMDVFLERNRSYIRGSVLEVGDDQYMLKYGAQIDRRIVIAGEGQHPRSESFEADLTKGSPPKLMEKRG
ncbi:hypothetical protein [Chlorobium phaeovibrioides]|uniref:hypothetical protein n=1 Tax=Chlorobium phaeovibrioides TaxID=1094 RepID=UPI00123158BB|nr:hypothetical protein [Chlorobium phaeovibrioides]QEQ57234.1 hypothetical protein FNV82_06380 [Chlorobium phaeovibrioides]